jgi:hypothetical protein
MPYLGDYLGQLVSEISMARMHADLETVRLAELYATHPLLRTMSVPRMRLPEVQLEIPVLIKASEEPRAGESARGGVPLADIRRQFDKVVAVHLSRADIALSAAEQEKLRATLDERLALHAVPIETAVDVYRVADDLTSTALRTLEGLNTKSITSPFAGELKEAVRTEFLKLRTPPPRLTVLVTSAEIREAGTTENLTRLHLKVSEEGVEWTTIEAEGVRLDRLIPE